LPDFHFKQKYKSSRRHILANATQRFDVVKMMSSEACLFSVNGTCSLFCRFSTFFKIRRYFQRM